MNTTDVLRDILEAWVLPQVAGFDDEKMHQLLVAGFKRFDSEQNLDALKDLLLLMCIVSLKTRELDETMEFSFGYHRRTNPLVSEWIGGPEKDLENIQQLVRHYHTYGVRYLQEETP